MADIQDIPRLVGEFTHLAKEYLRQETIEPAKRLGSFAGKSLAAALIWMVALVLLSVAGVRALIHVLPDGEYWQALAYVLYAVVLILFCVVLVKLVPTRGVHDGVPAPVSEESS